ncbi:hypothetical protein [Achromobacter sp. K91]|uniref:hypothetical protein n=1 Tax=Achromobacter sp. K91 TaxID=2292262 RepID=UPI0011C3BC48|nr:hypothetical protein [Achromobacter sp. K91]
MTDKTNTPAAQAAPHGAVLTDAMILHRWACYVSDPSAAYPLTDADKIAFARAIESALLSKLRAPVADERLSDIERTAITGLISVARAAFNVADDAEDDGDCVKVDRANASALGDALDALDELPDDQPGYSMGPSNKAEWALRRVLGLASAPVAGEAQQPYCYVLETRDRDGLLLDVEYNGSDSFSGGRKGGKPLYDHAAPQASEAVPWMGIDLTANGIADVRNATLEQVAALLENHIPATYFVSRASAGQIANEFISRPGKEVLSEAVLFIRALKTQPSAALSAQPEQS